LPPLSSDPFQEVLRCRFKGSEGHPLAGCEAGQIFSLIKVAVPQEPLGLLN
jgi:hypothetical protein